MRSVMDDFMIFKVYPTGYMMNSRQQDLHNETKTVNNVEKRLDFNELFKEQIGRVSSAIE